jgi:D-alanyl-D-alanine carboxypeptidase
VRLRACAAAVLAAALIAGCGGGGAKPAATPSPTPERGEPDLRESLSAALRDYPHGPGPSAATGAVMVRGRLVWSGAASAAGSPDDVFSLASLTKPFTATMVLQLAEQGRLSLRDTVGRRLGAAVPRRIHRVTIAQLLGHTSGLPDYLRLRALDDSRHRWTEHELLRGIGTPRHAGRFEYSNINYVLLGAIIRRAAGEPTGVHLRRAIAEPLGLERTSLTRSADLAEHVAGGGRISSEAWNELFTDGSLVASAPDVARFLDALLVDKRVLGEASLRRMLTPGPDGSYGLGLARVRHGRCELWGHFGAWKEWSTAGLTDQESGTTIVVLVRGATIPDDAPTTLLQLSSYLDAARITNC